MYLFIPADAKETQMLFGGGILGTILVVVLIIFVVRRL